MKERLALAFSWWAFLHTAIVVFAIIVDWDGAENMASSVDGTYFEIIPFVEEAVFAFGLPPAVWLVLWIVTGSPRILPWRK